MTTQNNNNSPYGRMARQIRDSLNMPTNGKAEPTPRKGYSSVNISTLTGKGTSTISTNQK